MKSLGHRTGRAGSLLILGCAALLSIRAAAGPNASRGAPAPPEPPQVAVPNLGTGHEAAVAARRSEAAPTETPSPVPQPIRLTEGGYCLHPFWSPDSQRVAFIDRPGLSPAAVYAVPLTGGPPELVTRRVGLFSPDWSLMAYRVEQDTFVERLEDRQRWVIPNGGRAVMFSASGRTIAWEVATRAAVHPDLRHRTIWTASPNGLGAEVLIQVIGGHLIGWVEGEEAVLVSGRVSAGGSPGIWRVSVYDGTVALLAEVHTPRDPLLSPGGGWLAYHVAFSADPEENGLWVLPTSGGEPRQLSGFGAYRWRAEGELLLIPLDLEGLGPALLQINVATGRSSQLTDPASTRLSIASNEWEPSPDGRWIVFASAEDGNLWLLDLGSP